MYNIIFKLVFENIKIDMDYGHIKSCYIVMLLYSSSVSVTLLIRLIVVI